MNWLTFAKQTWNKRFNRADVEAVFAGDWTALSIAGSAIQFDYNSGIADTAQQRDDHQRSGLDSQWRRIAASLNHPNKSRRWQSFAGLVYDRRVDARKLAYKVKK